MDLFENDIREFAERLKQSRTRILCNHGFYGILLIQMIYMVSDEVQTVCTDGVRIIFGKDFLEGLSDSELDFVLMHEILHIILRSCARPGTKDMDIYNTATEIVINSNILRDNRMKTSSITLNQYKTSIHTAPDGKEGYEYTVKEVCDMLAGKKATVTETAISGWDDHSRLEMLEKDEFLQGVWIKRIQDAATAVEIRDPSNTRGLLPGCVGRMLKSLRKAQTDWRTILNEFIQEDINDYTFSPPDRRFEDNPFFLPDFSEKDDTVKDILFMIDTSASMSDEMITAAYSEVKGAIDEFNGKISGWLGYFDAEVVKPQPFNNEAELKKIRAFGGGGTSFAVIFEYIRHMTDKTPVSIIILTDGYAPFPQERVAGGIPVLWLLNNDNINPPWGKTARINI